MPVRCMALFWAHLRGTPAPMSLIQKPLDQQAIGVWGLAMAAFGIPMMAFFVVALRMGQPKIEQVIAAAQAARIDMLDGGPEAGLSIEAQAPATDQTFAYPEAIRIGKGGVSGGNLIFLASGHSSSLPYCAAL